MTIATGALLNLVKANVMSAEGDHDYAVGSTQDSRFEEIKLETPDGEPCAVPSPIQTRSLDETHNLLTGEVARSARIHSHQINLNIDYIGTETARRLEQWQKERALVYLAPGFGRESLFAWRALQIADAKLESGATATDATGLWSLDEGPMIPGVRVWDYMRGRMTLPSKTAGTDYTLYTTNTPGGAGISYPANIYNRWVPGYPEGAGLGGGAGNSGWSTGGADFADISFTHKPDGFGPADCPDSLVVDIAANATADRYLLARSLWDPGHGTYQGYTFTGSGTCTGCIWLKGRMPDSATLLFNGGASASYSVDLSGLEFKGWTPVPFGDYDADWSASIPEVRLFVGDTDGHPSRFEIGAMRITQRGGTHANWGSWWYTGGGSGTNNSLYYTATTALEMPAAGTIFVSFYLPPDMPGNIGPFVLCSLIGGADKWDLRAGVNTSGYPYVQLTTITGFNYTVNPLGASNPAWNYGGLNTVALTYGTTETVAYINGVALAPDDRGTDQLDFSVPAAIEIGNGYANYGSHPARILSARIEEGALTAVEVANLHLAATDPGALGVALAARGRLFEIASVPSTIRHGADGSHILGSLVLNQVRYDHDYADPMHKERNFR